MRVAALDGEDPGDGRGDRDGARHRRGRRTLAMAVVAAVVLIAAIAVLASRTHDATVDDLAVAGGSTTTSPSTTPATIAVEAPTTEAITDVSVDDTPPADSTEPPTDPTTTDTTPPTPVPSIQLALNDSQQPQTYTAPFPQLTWSTSGVASVLVTGPAVGNAGLPSTSLGGSVCGVPRPGLRDALRLPTRQLRLRAHGLSTRPGT